MNYDLRLQRRVDWTVWAATVTWGLFALHEVHGATPPTMAKAPPSALVIATATAGAATRPTPEAIYRRECSDCHLAFAPRLLRASTWRQVMAGLDRHFGVDASLYAATTTAISTWLVQGAAASGGARAGDGAALRITATPWFVREHREVPAATWRRAAIGSAAHCAACHTDAERGRFSERALRIPN